MSNSVSNCVWFQKFMQDMHRRMGDVWRPNRAISQCKLSVCMEVLESKWVEAQETVFDKYDMKRIATTTCIVLAGYFASLWGEEINRVDLGAMIKYWDKATTCEKNPYVALMLSGTFKAETGIKFFCQPLALQMDNGRDIGVWFLRLLKICKGKGASKGPLFVRHIGERMSGAEMDLLFRALL